MNDMEMRARLKNLDQLGKEMDDFEASSYAEKKQAPKMVAKIEPEFESDSPQTGDDEKPPAVESSNIPYDEKGNLQQPGQGEPPRKDPKVYQDPNRQKYMDGVEASLRSRGQFSRSRKA